ncbi:MAG: GNAT family N-acetyltransferase [Bacteroides sp.]|nr:GNAT family N-acetyltransferase [Bacteroides sp.]MDE7441352.1 GNAT family N-acetyltransferase [Muribaculaceae bacterium]
MNRILSDDNLTLRPVEPADADFMWAVESDSLQWIQNSLVAPFSRENLHQYACNYEADPYLAEQLRLIIVDQSGKRMGIADLYELSSQHHTSWVGIYILPEFRRVGIALNALRLLEGYALKILNLRQIGAKIVEGNDISMQLFMKAGFEWNGTLKNWIQSGKDTFSLHILQKELLSL